jgi:hypothetical protein
MSRLIKPLSLLVVLMSSAAFAEPLRCVSELLGWSVIYNEQVTEASLQNTKGDQIAALKCRKCNRSTCGDEKFSDCDYGCENEDGWISRLYPLMNDVRNADIFKINYSEKAIDFNMRAKCGD